MPELRPGPRDHVVTSGLRRDIQELSDGQAVLDAIDAADAPARLAQHLMAEVQRILSEEPSASDQARRINELLSAAGAAPESQLVVPPELLHGVRGRTPIGDLAELPPLPAVPFSQSDLLVNADGQPNVGSELRAELPTADTVDLICAFVIWSGVRHVRDALEALVGRGGRIRVITTTYMGATEKRAVDELVRLGANVKVAFDARTTKLHAKAWLLERSSGLTTAFVGSSNLSHTALFDGLEWNVRLSSVDSGRVVDRVRMMFESHWASEHFEWYDPEVNGDELAQALAEHDRRTLGEASTISFANIEVRPYPHQQRMLDALTVERVRHNRHRNLIVAATGTGKTVVAALDYKQLIEARDTRPSLLFVAHREEILRQARSTYGHVLRDASFGELLGGGRTPAGTHVFAMIQSLSKERIAMISPDTFDVVVVDEFHHARAQTYDRLLKHLEPTELLGLTATPERLDGKDVTEWFDHRIAVELRLWEAIDQGFLVPFQYFGVADGTDLREIAWRRGGYVIDELSNLLSNDDARVANLIESIQRIVLDPQQMRALGFCVSVEHARFMARRFSQAGLASVALTGEDSADSRATHLRELQQGKLRCIFSVEVLGEGVDVPDVDCLLLLRPTASPTLFSQQLGRGLRRAVGKSHLTVIDMIGQHRKEFRFEERLSAILDRRRGTIRDQVAADFPFLPAGCTIDLDRQSRELILDNLKEAVQRSRWDALVEDLRRAGHGTTLGEFLEQYGHRLEDVYRGERSWMALKRAARLRTTAAADTEREGRLLRALGRLTHIDDPERIGFYSEMMSRQEAPQWDTFDARHQRLLTMLAWGLGSGHTDSASVAAFFQSIWPEAAVRSEFAELLGVLDSRSRTVLSEAVLPGDIPLTLHARYTRQEVVAALGHGDGPKPLVTQGGVLWAPRPGCDVFFVDLQKSERDYSPTTMYRDYALNRQLFHWESQSRQATTQRSVRRYIDHAHQGTKVLLFVRETKRYELGTRPFAFLGAVRYVDHRGERPVAFTWALPHPMPETLFEVARSVAVA